jgi:hypothetical protein
MPGHEHGVSAVGWSADGGLIFAAGAAGSLNLWEAGSGRCLVSRSDSGGYSWPSAACFSPDGRHALVASREGFKLWDLYTGRCLREFAGHGGSVRSLALSADGRYALAGGQDQTVRLWQLDWELEPKPVADWDDGARPYLELFLNRHTPSALPERGQSRRSGPAWTEDDFGRLLGLLAAVGYGWLRSGGVRRELEQMGATRSAPRPGGLRAWLARLLGGG